MKSLAEIFKKPLEDLIEEKAKSDEPSILQWRQNRGLGLWSQFFILFFARDTSQLWSQLTVQAGASVDATRHFNSTDEPDHESGALFEVFLSAKTSRTTRVVHFLKAFEASGQLPERPLAAQGPKNEFPHNNFNCRSYFFAGLEFLGNPRVAIPKLCNHQKQALLCRA